MQMSTYTTFLSDVVANSLTLRSISLLSLKVHVSISCSSASFIDTDKVLENLILHTLDVDAATFVGNIFSPISLLITVDFPELVSPKLKGKINFERGTETRMMYLSKIIYFTKYDLLK